MLAIAVALVAPGSPDAAASPQSATESERTVESETATAASTSIGARRVPTAPVLHADVDVPVAVQLVVSPIDGGDLAVYPMPGAPAPSQVLPAVNELGSPLVLLAVLADGDWYEVLLPTRPNGSSAWVPMSAVRTSQPAYRVDVSLSAYRLDVVRIADGAVVLTSPIGIGSPARPTPTGLSFVRDLFPTEGANHPYGPMAFGLSSHSDVLMEFGTGDGRIAIHGTNQPSSIGAAVSNGCPHVPNDVALALIDYLTLGTPVTIS